MIIKSSNISLINNEYIKRGKSKMKYIYLRCQRCGKNLVKMRMNTEYLLLEDLYCKHCLWEVEEKE